MPTLPYTILSYPILSYPILSYPTLPHPTLPFPTFNQDLVMCTGLTQRYKLQQLLRVHRISAAELMCLYSALLMIYKTSISRIDDEFRVKYNVRYSCITDVDQSLA